MKQIIPCMLLVALFLACGKSPQQETGVQPAVDTRIPVRVALVHEKIVTDRFRVSGEIAPLWSLDVQSDAAGKIIEKRVVLGERVHKDQVLARLLQDVPGMEFGPVDIKAPANGIIMADMIEVGSRVTPQRPAFTIANLDSVLVYARLLESDWSRLRAGSRCSIRVDALPGRDFAGRVRKLPPALDARTRTAAAEIVLANGGQALRPGMSVDCEFETGSRKALMLSLDAISRAGAGYRVIKIVDGRAQFTEISAGDIIGQEMVVSGKIELGETVVVYGQNMLQEGALVVIVK